MNLETFFEKFELFAEAPNGVQKLRELILQLAVQGKLVPQDPSDESASALFKKIQLEKNLLFKQGNLDKSKPLLPIEFDEAPYNIPDSWIWTKVGHICISIVSNRDKPKSFSGGFPWITLSNLDDKKIELVNNHSSLGLSSNEVKEYNARVIPSGSVIMSCVGRFGLVAVLDQDVVTNQQIHGFVVTNSLCSKYVAYAIKSQKQFLETIAQSTTISYLNKSKCESIPVPLPPLSEECRIVAKVDQLMSLCDKLEERQKKKRETRVLLSNVAINQLLTAREPDTFAKHWQRICNNFDLLYNAPENIGKLRQTILQLAVMGKLVPQDSNDEPASVLLDKIRFEKELLTRERKISQSKLLPSIQLEEIPYNVPKGWMWERFGQIADIVSGVTKGRNLITRKTAYYPYLRVANVQRGFLDLEIIKNIEIPVEELDKYRLQTNDILLTEGGDWDKLGRSAIWKGQIENCIHQNHIFRARPFHVGLTSQWAVLYTNSPIGRQYFETASKKTTNLASINMTQLRHCPFPIPPIEEQKRIAAKVDQLMDICDKLEAKLTQSQNDSEKLMDVGVRQLLSLQYYR
ncbi:restriction endonuclease subunit S [Nostoc sp.]|uniref:restriction endonuclease subunit S n=1 Tax=Nostoc sp. TaxID=1180 RepID=UPI002FF66655